LKRDFIQQRLLAGGALDGLNEDARLVLYVVVETCFSVLPSTYPNASSGMGPVGALGCAGCARNFRNVLA
jgi:hypothetical protein